MKLNIKYILGVIVGFFALCLAFIFKPKQIEIPTTTKVDKEIEQTEAELNKKIESPDMNAQQVNDYWKERLK